MRSAVHALLTILCLAAPAAASDIAGFARVVDGDTIVVAGMSIRVHGIDAVETGQTCRTEHGVRYDCGRVVTDWARDAWDGAWAVCEDLGDGGYGRTLGRCRIRGVDIAAQIVERGFALAYVEYSDDYAGLEEAARASKVGLWSGALQRPQAFRRYGNAAPAPDAACTIKGNRSSGGLIFHLPGSRHYDRTRIDEARGERWFCTVAEAVGAGWRAPRG